MTGENHESRGPVGETKGEADDHDDERMRALLKRAIEAGAPPVPAKPDLLRGVQRRIRKRSRGKFFADGWSTSSPRVSYALVAIAMLVLVALAWFALGPVGFSAR